MFGSVAHEYIGQISRYVDVVRFLWQEAGTGTIRQTRPKNRRVGWYRLHKCILVQSNCCSYHVFRTPVDPRLSDVAAISLEFFPIQFGSKPQKYIRSVIRYPFYPVYFFTGSGAERILKINVSENKDFFFWARRFTYQIFRIIRIENRPVYDGEPYNRVVRSYSHYLPHVTAVRSTTVTLLRIPDQEQRVLGETLNTSR